jgi:hypothetical protein
VIYASSRRAPREIDAFRWKNAVEQLSGNAQEIFLFGEECLIYNQNIRKQKLAFEVLGNEKSGFSLSV